MHGTWCFEQEPCVPIKQTWNDMWTCNHKPWTQPFFNVLFGMIFTYFHIVCCNEHAGYGVSCVQQDFRNRYRSEWNGLFFLWWKTTMCCNIVRKHFWEKQIIDMVPCQYIAPMDCDIVWTYYRQIHHKSNKHKLIIYYLVVTFIHQLYIIYTSSIHHLYIIYTLKEGLNIQYWSVVCLQKMVEMTRLQRALHLYFRQWHQPPPLHWEDMRR